MSATTALSGALTLSTRERSGLFRIGGAAFIAVGVLFLAKYLFELSGGQPPQDGAGVLSWRSASQLQIEMANELLFIAAISLVPAVIALFRALDGAHHITAATGCAIMAVLIPILAML